MRILRIAIGVSLTVSVALFVAWSWRWPLVGDASLIHYIAFLIGQGWAPYREIGDMNMPGSFLIEMAAMKVFGADAVGWRMYDFTLLAVAAGSFRVMTKRAGWFAAVFAGGMFALVHGRDGLVQGGQRDLTMAVLLACSTALLMTAVRRARAGHAAAAGWVGFGLLAGVALTIKPTALPLSLAELGVAVMALRRPTSQKRDVGSPVLAAGCGMLVGPAIALAFLWRERALQAFWANLHGLVPYYASLGHRPLGFLLLHSVSPLLALVLLWLAVWALARPRLDWERAALLCGVLFGMGGYVVQARGFPYHRYPLLAFLLPLLALDFAEAMRLVASGATRLKAAGWLAVAAVCVGGLWLGPQSAVLVHRFRWWEQDFNTTLEANLERLGGARLSGHIQCVDFISGCDTTLYRMRLLPASGVLLDFPLFGDARAPFVQQAREEFRAKVFARPPAVVVVTTALSALYLDGPGGYRKLGRWPEMQEFLAGQYRLDTDWTPPRPERWWSREEYGPGYRIYVRDEMQTIRQNPLP